MRPKRNPESGYALLMIFAMAAVVAITLYSEVPRAAFEAQRDKEQLLIDRGQEYSRAIALFVRKFNRFPATMEELENTNRQRFLRRRFVDPMTGKTDWRMLHAGPGGVITDSVTSAAKPQDGISTPSNFTQLQMFGAAQGPGNEGVNLASRVRPSDQAGAAGNVSNPTTDTGNQNSSSGNGNGGNTSLGGSSGYNGPVMVLPDGRIVPANNTGIAPPANPNQPGIPGMPTPGMPGTQPGFPGGVPGGPALPSGVAIQQNSSPLPPGVGGPPASASSLINQILTTPRPGGINGIPGQGGPGGGQSVGGQSIGGQGVNAQGQPLTSALTNGSSLGQPQQNVVGAGLAGVASKREQEGIKEYNERTKYNEWEFVYDITKDPTKNGAGAGGAVGATGAPGSPGGPGRGGFAPGQPSSPFGLGSGPTGPGR